MSFLLALILVLLASTAWAQDTQPPPTPTNVVVGAGTPGLNVVTFPMTWDRMLDPPGNQPVPLYTWVAGYSDGQTATGTAPTNSMTLSMPYHLDGAAASGFVCIGSKDAAGNVSPQNQCFPVPVPAKPTAPPVSTLVTLEYNEPSTNACVPALPCPPLTDLRTTRAYYTLGTGAEQSQDFMVSSGTGGQHMTASFSVPVNTGTIVVALTALNSKGLESARSVSVSALLNTLGAPGKGNVNVIKITQ